MELTFKNGNATLDKHIPYVKENLGKILLVSESGGSEGIWAMFSEEGKRKYEDDSTKGVTEVVVLCNDSLAGVPWGSYAKIEYHGEKRPIVVCEDIFTDGQVFQYADWAAESICNSLAKSIQDGTFKLDEPAARNYVIEVLKSAGETDVTAALKSLLEQ